MGKKHTKKKRKTEADDQQSEALTTSRKGTAGASGKKKTSSAKHSSRSRTAHLQQEQGEGARTDRKRIAANRTVQSTLNARHDNGPTPLISADDYPIGGIHEALPGANPSIALCNTLVTHENNPKGKKISAETRPQVTKKEW